MKNYKKIKFKYMKKLLFFILCLTLFIPFRGNSQALNNNDLDTSNYPYWIEMMQNQNVNFYQTQSAFNKYWHNRKRQKGDGYKVFKRWEYFWSKRINPDGSYPNASSVQNAYNEFLQQYSPGQSSGGSWVSLGPTILPTNGTGQPNGLGRVNCVAFHPTNTSIIYAGSPSGGLWKTTTGGSSWSAMTDNLATLGISAILVHPSYPDTMYIGTGDRDAGDALGLGVWRSSNAGVSWTNISGTMGNVTVNMMLMHPSNSQILFAATAAGIYKTINGGIT